MSEFYAHRCYEVTFNNPKYNATYNFIREKVEHSSTAIKPMLSFSVVTK